MASHRVQNYLEKHKIGPLFESLMGRVVQDTPDDPVGYIINILKGIHKKQRIVTDLNDQHTGARSSSGARPSSRNSRQISSQKSELNGINPRSNNLAASWSAGEAQVSSKSREYPRPWTSNSKAQVENRTWSPEENIKLERGEETAWNSDTRVPTHDFDEWFQMEQGEEKPSQKLPQEKYDGGKSWDDHDKATSEKTLQSRDAQPSVDDLNSELKLGQYKKSKSPTRNTDDALSATTSRSRPVKARRAVEEHRQQLQALLLEDGTGKSKEPKRLQHSPEEGMEILERMEDLQEEGLATAALQKGAKLDKSKRSKTDENMSVTICARCARIIGGQADDDASSQVRSSFSAVPFDGIKRKGDDLFDNYDSASQASEIVVDNLSSRQRNAWPMASDSESEVTARNNVSFKQRVKSPETKRMYRNSSSPEPSSRISTSRSNYDVSDGFLNSPRKSWAINGHSSENETEVEASRASTPGSMNGQPWNIPSDKNSDDENKASRLGSTGFPRVERHNRRSTKFTSDASSIGDTDY